MLFFNDLKPILYSIKTSYNTDVQHSKDISLAVNRDNNMLEIPFQGTVKAVKRVKYHCDRLTIVRANTFS